MYRCLSGGDGKRGSSSTGADDLLDSGPRGQVDFSAGVQTQIQVQLAAGDGDAPRGVAVGLRRDLVVVLVVPVVIVALVGAGVLSVGVSSIGGGARG